MHCPFCSIMGLLAVPGSNQPRASELRGIGRVLHAAWRHMSFKNPILEPSMHEKWQFWKAVVEIPNDQTSKCCSSTVDAELCRVGRQARSDQKHLRSRVPLFGRLLHKVMPFPTIDKFCQYQYSRRKRDSAPTMMRHLK